MYKDLYNKKISENSYEMAIIAPLTVKNAKLAVNNSMNWSRHW